AGGPFAVALSTSTKVSPRIPAVLSNVTESLRRLKEYLVLTFIVTSTGVIGLPVTMRIPFTLPMSTPAKRTGAPSRRPPALSKYERIVILRVNHPPVPLIRKISTMSVALAATTVSPTRSCDHFSCFWLGKVVSKRHNIITKVSEIRARRFVGHEKMRRERGRTLPFFRPGCEEWEPSYARICGESIAVFVITGLPLLSFIALLFGFCLFLRFFLSLLLLSAGLGALPRRRPFPGSRFSVSRFMVLRTCRGAFIAISSRLTLVETAFATGRPRPVPSRELARPGRGRNGRTPMIFGREQLPVLASGMFVLPLRCQRLGMRLVRVPFLFRRGPRYNAAGTVESHMRVIHDNGAAVHVPDIGHVHVHHGAVVEEGPASPLSAEEAHAAVSEPVINAAVEADVRSPIAGMPAIEAARKAPVTGGPEHAHRRDYPRAGNPVIAAVFIPSPITRSPEISRARTDGLRIYRQRGRSDPHRDANPNPDLRRRWRCHRQHRNRQHQDA